MEASMTNAGEHVNWAEWSYILKKVIFTPDKKKNVIAISLVWLSQQNIPRQTNAVDCGVFACQVRYATYLSLYVTVTF